MAKIFISYSHKDSQHVRSFAQSLDKNSGVSVWLDEFDLRAGDSIGEEIEKAIQSSDYVLLMASANSIASPYVNKEWRTKFDDELSTGKVCVIAILMADFPPEDLPVFLKTKKAISFTTPIKTANEINREVNSRSNREYDDSLKEIVNLGMTDDGSSIRTVFWDSICTDAFLEDQDFRGALSFLGSRLDAEITYHQNWLDERRRDKGSEEFDVTDIVFMGSEKTLASVIENYRRCITTIDALLESKLEPSLSTWKAVLGEYRPPKC